MGKLAVVVVLLCMIGGRKRGAVSVAYMLIERLDGREWNSCDTLTIFLTIECRPREQGSVMVS